MSTKSYAARAETHPTIIGRKLLRIMAEKKTNLCLSIDVTDPAEVLSIVESTSPLPSPMHPPPTNHATN